MTDREPICSPLCGASKAYGRFDQPWKHEPECPVRQEHDADEGLRERLEELADRWDAEPGDTIFQFCADELRAALSRKGVQSRKET